MPNGTAPARPAPWPVWWGPLPGPSSWHRSFFGLGAFIGALVGAWLGCLVMELLRGRPGKEAFDAAFGTMMGRFLGTVCKLGTGSAMVVLTAHRIWPDMAPVPPPLRPVAPEPGQVVMLLKNWLC